MGADPYPGALSRIAQLATLEPGWNGHRASSCSCGMTIPEIVEEYPTLSEEAINVVSDYIATRGTVSPGVEGRIVERK